MMATTAALTAEIFMVTPLEIIPGGTIPESSFRSGNYNGSGNAGG
jgi:hypothetical protein